MTDFLVVVGLAAGFALLLGFLRWCEVQAKYR